MSTILNIDTCRATAHISISREGKVVSFLENKIQKDHASFLHNAIKELLNLCGSKSHDLEAIAVTAGPGSYTGIRIGMAAAKGLCLALDKPLILINSLELLAQDIIKQLKLLPSERVLICPMIDARRMEVFTSLYDLEGQQVMSPAALILTMHTFNEYLKKHTIYYVGDGAAKWKEMSGLDPELFKQNVNIPDTMATISFEKFLLKAFADKAYSEPIYLKGLYEG